MLQRLLLLVFGTAVCFFIWAAFVVEDVVWYVRDVDVDVDLEVFGRC